MKILVVEENDTDRRALHFMGSQARKCLYCSSHPSEHEVIVANSYEIGIKILMENQSLPFDIVLMNISGAAVATCAINCGVKKVAILGKKADFEGNQSFPTGTILIHTDDLYEYQLIPRVGSAKAKAWDKIMKKLEADNG